MEAYTEEEVKKIQEELRPIEQKLLFGISEWWGEGDYGTRGKIITDDKKLYEYLFNCKMPSRTYLRNENYIKLVKTLNNNEYNTVLEFINKKIKGRQSEDNLIFDAGTAVSAQCDGSLIKISNSHDIIFEEAKNIFTKIE
jgi:coproporphyrinogen III oxidase